MSKKDMSQYYAEAKKREVKLKTQNKRLSGVPLQWAILMVCFSFVYLFPEAIFNSMLVTVVGGAQNIPYDREDVEIFGRAISGIGVTLLLADVIISKMLISGKIKTRTKSYLVFFIIGLFVWPTVFWGQKWLIDHYLIEPSSAEERQFAMFSQMVKSAVVMNAIEIDGIPFDSNDDLSPQEMSFLGVFPSLMYVNDNAISNIRGKQNSIATKYFKNKMYNGFDSYYSGFKEVREEFVDSYKEYRIHSDKYVDTLNSSGSETNDVLERINKEMRQKHNRVLAKKNEFKGKARSNSKKMAKDFYKYMKNRNRLVTWKNWPKVRKLDARFDRKLSQEGFGGVSHEYFLMEGNRFSDDPEHMRRKLLGLMYAKFERQEGFYPEITYEQFIVHPEVMRKLRNELSNEGLNLKSNWTLKDKRGLHLAVHNRIKKEADEEWNKNPTVQELGITPNLTWVQFYKSAGVQNKIKKVLNASGLNTIVDLNWNNIEFKKGFIDPMIKVHSTDLISALNESISEFEDGGKLEERSKDALRATLVPPISMGLSLFLVVLTAFKLPLKIINLFTIKNKKVLLAKKLAPVVVIALIVSAPFVVSKGVTKSNTTVVYLLDNVKESIHPSSAFALEWLIKAQPMFYPIGKYFEDNLQFADFVSKISNTDSELLNYSNNDEKPVDMENKVSPAVSRILEEPKASKSKISKDGKYPLTIIASPHYAKIQVMNIGPVYKEGMRLPAGDYTIRVSANGYKSKTDKVTLSPYANTFNISLHKN